MESLNKSRVFRLFSELNKIPRGSGNEKAVSDYIAGWARDLGLDVVQDDIWDLIIFKPAGPGCRDSEPVILQAHMDMVCEKNSGSDHDFLNDPIDMVVEGDWLRSACGTTLGADNGIGVAMAMAVLEDKDLPHPPLEVIFTVQEETTFAGAEGVDVSGLSSRRIINLDHAAEDELIVGSCGGVGVELTMKVGRAGAAGFAGSGAPEAARESEAGSGAGPVPYRLAITGFLGGHSGEDIHRGRGNAIVLLIRLLEMLDLPVVCINGGTNRLAIPREAEAVVLVDTDIQQTGQDAKAVKNGNGTDLSKVILDRIEEAKVIFTKEYGRTAPDMDIVMEPVEKTGCCGDDPDCCGGFVPLDEMSLKKIFALIRLYPNGIVEMSGDFPGVVMSSDNIGIVETTDDTFKLVSEVRGAYSSSVDSIEKSIRSVAELVGAEVNTFAPYVPWEFRAESKLRATAAALYKERTGSEMKQIALHAGLECGAFAEKIPGIDAISIGPDCQSFHSPEERVSISSTERVFDFLKELLKRI